MRIAEASRGRRRFGFAEGKSARRQERARFIITIKGKSFRLKEKHRAGLLRQQAPENTAVPTRDSAKSPG